MPHSKHPMAPHEMAAKTHPWKMIFVYYQPGCPHCDSLMRAINGEPEVLRMTWALDVSNLTNDEYDSITGGDNSVPRVYVRKDPNEQKLIHFDGGSTYTDHIENYNLCREKKSEKECLPFLFPK